MRVGQYSEGQASATTIHITFFDQEGISVGGHSVAKYIDGEWGLTPYSQSVKKMMLNITRNSV